MKVIEKITHNKVSYIEPREVYKNLHLFDNLIDVRTQEEFFSKAGHIEGSQLITLGDHLKSFLSMVDENKKLLFISNCNGRSLDAAKMALVQGFKDVNCLNGGIEAWQQQSYPLFQNSTKNRDST